MAKIGDYVDKYVALRDKKKAIEARHKEELAPFNEMLSKLEDFFAKTMDTQGLRDLKSDSATAYRSELVSVKTADSKAFLDFIKENDAWHLMDIRPAKTAVSEYVEEQGVTPPGVNIERFSKVNVRKS